MAVRVMNLWLRSLGDLRVLPTDRRVRAMAGGAPVVDSQRAALVWEPRRVVPSYAVPADDVHAPLMPVDADAGRATVPPDVGGPFLDHGSFRLHTTAGEELTVQLPHGRLEAAAFRPGDPDLAGYVILDFDAFESWFEEDDPVVGHPPDPFHRVEVRRSSRHVRVLLGDRVLADSRRSTMVFEPLLPVRFYLPRDDVDQRSLQPSARRTTCAYKGEAAYWSVQLDGYLVEDLVWCYERPLPEAARLAGLMCFFDERVDVEVDGRLRPRPLTHWS